MSISGLLAASLLAFATNPSARAHLVDLEVGLDGNQVLVGFELRNGFDDKLLERIQSGLPSGFLYTLELYRDHKRWFDNRLDRTRLSVVAMYNAVSREYLVNYKQNGTLVESRTVREIDELEQAMTTFDSLPVFVLDDLPASWRLLVRLRADLGSKTVLTFIPARISTETVESRKFRPPSVP